MLAGLEPSDQPEELLSRRLSQLLERGSGMVAMKMKEGKGEGRGEKERRGEWRASSQKCKNQGCHACWEGGKSCRGRKGSFRWPTLQKSTQSR